MIRSLLALVLGAWASAATAASPAILVLGDSLSAGYGIDVDQGWVALLQKRLDAEGYRYQVINASISGDTTRGALSRLPPLLARYRPRIVMVELGGNDGLRGLSLDDMRRNLAAIVEQSRTNGASVLLAGERLPPNYGEAYVEKFLKAYRDVARDYRVPLVPLLLEGIGGHPELMQEDGLHPNARAQTRVLDNVWPHLLPLLKKH
jgi:acyl-CoA thioesterase-1